MNLAEQIIEKSDGCDNEIFYLAGRDYAEDVDLTHTLGPDISILRFKDGSIISMTADATLAFDSIDDCISDTLSRQSDHDDGGRNAIIDSDY